MWTAYYIHYTGWAKRCHALRWCVKILSKCLRISETLAHAMRHDCLQVCITQDLWWALSWLFSNVDCLIFNFFDHKKLVTTAAKCKVTLSQPCTYVIGNRIRKLELNPSIRSRVMKQSVGARQYRMNYPSAIYYLKD